MRDFLQILASPKLAWLWRAPTSLQPLICATAALPVMAGEYLFGGNMAVGRVIKRLRRQGCEAANERMGLGFVYRNIYYSLRAYYDYAWLINASEAQIKRGMQRADIRGLDNIVAALKSGKGTVAFSAHLGCFFTLLFARPFLDMCRGRRVTLLAPQVSAARKQRIKERLQHFAPDVEWDLVDIQLKSSGMKIVRTLRSGGIVGCTLDYAYPFTRNQVVKFFGRQVEFPIGVLTIGQRLGSVFVPAFTYLERNTRVMEFQTPIGVHTTHEPNQVSPALIEQVNAILEAKIAALPAQWSFWQRLACEVPMPEPEGASGLSHQAQPVNGPH